MGLGVVQVGIRAVAPEEAEYLDRQGLKPFWAHALNPLNDSWIPEAISRLPQRVYLTIDLDGLDPSVIPGTGTPEPGGLSYRQVAALIRALGRERTVVAADIVELSKIPGNQVSEYTAARHRRQNFQPLPLTDICLSETTVWFRPWCLARYRAWSAC